MTIVSSKQGEKEQISHTCSFSTYFVQDSSNQEEMARLQILDRMITTGMGGVLPEQPDPTVFHRVLDVGCGTGGWLIDASYWALLTAWGTNP